MTSLTLTQGSGTINFVIDKVATLHGLAGNVT
jgi:hypothetical protein